MVYRHLTFFIVSCIALLFKAGYGADFDNAPKLIVKGDATVFKPADQMIVTLAVYTVADNSNSALVENNKKMAQVIVNLKAIGLKDSDYQTGKVSVRPIYQKTGKDQKEDRTKMDHFEAVNTIEVKTLKIDLAPKIFDEAVKGGVNQIRNVNFNLNNPQVYQSEVIHLATSHALGDAQALADAAHVRLKRILSISLDQWRPRMQQAAPMYAKTAEFEEEISTPVEIGDVEIQASVNITFEIESL